MADAISRARAGITGVCGSSTAWSGPFSASRLQARELHATFDDDTPCGTGILPDGICLYREGAVWVAAFEDDAFTRLDANGRELQRINVPGRGALACVLGGPELRTLFCLSAATYYEELRQRKSSSRIDAVDVEIAGSGHP